MKTVSWLLLIAILFVPSARTLGAGQKNDKQPATIEQIKIQVAKLGVGEKARATITRKDGTKAKGYISTAGDDNFVIRDRKTDAPTTISYVDVAKVQADKGHSTAKHFGLGIGIGVGAFLGILLIVFSRLND
jgi:hypothetical protein